VSEVLGVSGSLVHSLAVEARQSGRCASRGTPVIVEARQLVTIDVAGGQSGFVLLSNDTRLVEDSLSP